MKEYSALYNWFWKRPLFRNLQLRLMNMILVLVLPLCVLCVLIASTAIQYSTGLHREMEYNGLAAFMDRLELRCQYEGIDVTENFPSAVAPKVVSLYATVGSRNGKIYLSDDGASAWLIASDGTYTPADISVDELQKTGQSFYYACRGIPLQIVGVFPRNISLATVHPWFWVSLGISLLALALCPFLYIRLKKNVIDPLNTLQTAQESLAQDAAYRIPPQPERCADDFLRLYDSFNSMAEEIQASHEKDVRLLETEMDNLRLQVNPHMLLNSYNMIYALAESKNYSVIQDYTLCLVDYFRYVLRRGQQLVTVKQELDFVDNFIHIQRIRFPNRFSYVYQAEADCLRAMIPPLLIENFVENSIKYALNPQEAIEIIVSVRKETNDSGQEQLHIAVTDTGSGIRPEVLEKLRAGEPYIDEAGHKHIGIWNCIRRIELFYGERGEVHFTSKEGQGTQAYMVIPCVYNEEGKA